MKYRFVLLLFCLGIVLTFTSGCATIMTGTTQKVPVTSTPSGATAVADGKLSGITPCDFTLERKTDHTIEISKENYYTATVALTHTLSGATVGNAIFGGIIGIGVDAASGAMYKLVPEKVDVTLEVKESGERKEEAPVPEEPTIQSNSGP